MTKSGFNISIGSSLKCGVALSALLLAGTAFAQTAASGITSGNRAPELSDKDVQEIIVTGTLIRGIAPPGTNVIGVNAEAVQASGATTTAQLLQSIPQLGQFNNLLQPSGAFNNVSSNRPNLRNLPGFNTAGSSPTLVLVDGHRVVGVGIQSTSPDPDIIPPALIERIEVVPDGGSAIYGSDAVAGVLNFITKKKFNGFQVDSHYGRASDYHSFDANLTAGKAWETGSAYISYNYSEHGSVYGRDRDYYRTPEVLVGGLRVQSLRCAPGNVQVGSTLYALPFTTGSAVANTANSCDESDGTTIYPSEFRHSVMAGLSQDLTDSIKFDVRGYFTSRVVTSNLGQYVQSSLIGPFSTQFFTGSPYYSQHRAQPTNPFELQSVSYAWGGPNDQLQRLSSSTWGIAPTITADLGKGWQLRALASYGESTTENHVGQPNTSALNPAIASGAFNPYDPNASSAVGLRAVSNYETFGKTRQQLFNARLVLDGALFTLPGGDVKLAVGVEYNREALRSQKGTIVPGTENTGFAGLNYTSPLGATTTLVTPYAATPIVGVKRHTKSVFGELVVPIVGTGNAMPGIQQLTVSASGRYDDYSDFGDTFNPKFGLTYKPVSWIKLRGSWGKSFVAPSLADDSRTDITSFNRVNDASGALSFLFPSAALIAAGRYPDPGANRNIAILLGSKPGIQPEKATTWSLGTDIQPPFLPGLNLSVTYWNIQFNNLITVPNFTGANFYSQFGSLIFTNPSQALINSYLAQANTSVGPLTSCNAPTNCYAVIDARKTNLGNYKVDGLDFGVNYTLPTSFGAVDLSVNANYDLNRKQQPVDGQPYVDQIKGLAGRFKSSTVVGAQIGNLRAQVTWNYTGGYDLLTPVGINGIQTRVSSFNVFNLFFKYDFNGEGALKNLSLTVNANNLFDQAPPYYLQQSFSAAGQGYINGNTIGRFVQAGISKKF